MKKMYATMAITGICVFGGILSVAAKEPIQATTNNLRYHIECMQEYLMNTSVWMKSNVVTDEQVVETYCDEGHANCNENHTTYCNEGHANCNGKHNTYCNEGHVNCNEHHTHTQKHRNANHQGHHF